MLEFLFLVALLSGVVLVALFAKVAFGILCWPFKALFWILGGLFALLLLPFQLLGAVILAVIAIPLVVLGLVLAVGVALPVLLVVGAVVMVALVLGGIAAVGALLVH